MAKRVHKASSVAQTLNRLTDRAFVDGLSAGDSDALALLVEDYFCNNEGMHKTNYSSIHDA